MALDRNDIDLLAEAISRANRAGGGSVGGGTTTGSATTSKSTAGATRATDDLTISIERSRESFQNLQKSSKEYGTTAKLNNIANGLFKQTTEKSERYMRDLNTAIHHQESALDEARKSGNVNKEKEIQGTLKTLQTQKLNQERTQQSTGAIGESVKGMVGGFAQLQNALIGIEAQYQANMMQMISQGASGFSLFGASVEANIERVSAATHAYADAAKSAGSALGQMGGVILPLVGFALNLMADRAKAVADANKTLALQGIRILVEEGNKLIKTHMAMTSSGLIFANGMQGLVNATEGTKLRLEEMAEVVKNNKEAFVGTGLGMADATARVGKVAKMFAAETGQFAKMDRQLLALGYSYQEQAGMAAETLSNMRRGANGQAVTDKQVAETTASYAKNLALLNQLSGDDAKRQQEKVKAENTTLAFEMEKAKMSPKQRAELDAAMSAMTELERKNLRERMIYGTVINKQGAVMEAQVPSMRKNGEEFAKQLKANQLTAQSVLDVNAKTGDKVQKEILKNGRGVALALDAGKGDVEGAGKGMADKLRKTFAETPKAIAEANKSIVEQTEAAKGPTTAGDPTAALLDAIEIGAVAAKNMQNRVVQNIGEIAEQLKKHYKGLEDAYAKRNFVSDGGGGGSQDLMNMAIAAMIALPIVRGLLSGGWTAAMNKVKTGSWMGKVTPEAPTPATAAATPAANAKNVSMSTVDRAKEIQAKTPGMSSKDALAEARRTGGFKQLAEAESKIAQGLAKSGPAITTVTNEAGMLSKSMSFMKSGFQKLGTKIPLVGTALAVTMAGFNIAGIEAREAAGEISADQARIEEGGVVGGAVGGLSGGLAGAAAGAAIGSVVPVIGTVIGGLIGGALGAWGGEALGAELGESLMSHWGSITEFASNAGKTVADTWAATKNWLTTDGAAYWGMFKSGAAELGSKALDLAKSLPVIGPIVQGVESALSSAKAHFQSAGKMVSGFLSDSAAKFKQTFPELTAGVEKVVGSMKTGLGSLMESISATASKTWGWVKEKTGFADKPETPSTAKPAAKPAEVPPTTKPADKPVAVPANATPVAPATRPSAAKSTPVVATAAVPEKKGLTAAEKAAVYETIATNTKYTADLLASQQKNMESLQRQMIQLLGGINQNTSDTATSSKKIAGNTK